MKLGERWRAGRPEVVVLAGSVLAVAGNAVMFAAIVSSVPLASWPAPTAVHGLGIALALALPVLVRRGTRSARRFVPPAIAATAVALLTFGGLPGGLVALVGSIWGLLATYEPVPARA